MLNPVIRIGEQISEVIRYHNLNKSKEDIFEILKKLKLDEPERFLNSYPHQISGGERQRICIAISLLPNPKIIVADEPTSALDTITQRDLISTLKSIHMEHSLTSILITHNPFLAKDFSNRIVVIYGGMTMEEDKTESIFSSPLHPYTKDLLSCSITTEKKELKKLKCFPSSGTPTGCPYSPRCSQKIEACATKVPPLVKLNSKSIRCHLYT